MYAECGNLSAVGRLPEAERHCSDGYAVYGWLPTSRHEVGKYGPVNWNEGLHSWLLGKLNRLVRRTKGYTKSVAMLVYSLALVCWNRWAKSNFSASRECRGQPDRFSRRRQCYSGSFDQLRGLGIRIDGNRISAPPIRARLRRMSERFSLRR